jgi:hypothetical protein
MLWFAQASYQGIALAMPKVIQNEVPPLGGGRHNPILFASRETGML